MDIPSNTFPDCNGNYASTEVHTWHNSTTTGSPKFDMYKGTQLSVNTYFAQLEKKTGLCAPYKLAHAVLRTAHLDETIRHYEMLLNARMVFDQRPYGAAITYDEEHHRLAFVAVPELADKSAGEGLRVADATGAVGVDFAVAPGLEKQQIVNISHFDIGSCVAPAPAHPAGLA